MGRHEIDGFHGAQRNDPFVRARIAHSKAPKRSRFEPLPRTATGKIQKFVLRDREWGSRTTRIG